MAEKSLHSICRWTFNPGKGGFVRKRLLIIAGVLVCFVLLLMFLVFSRGSDSLVYEGRHLAEWLPLVQSASQQERDRAERAVREIGADALPFLEEMVRNAHFDSFKVKTDRWIFRKEFPVHNIRRMVFSGYGALQVDAKPSVPRLLEMLKDNQPTVRSTAIGALGWIGPTAKEAVPGLITELRDDVGYVRRDAASALGRICAGSNDPLVIGVLKESLNDKDSSVQEYAGRAIESVQADAGDL